MPTQHQNIDSMSERGQGENLKKGFVSEIDTNIIGNYLENESGNF